MSSIELEQTCAIIHGKVGNWIYRHYRLGYTQKVPYYTPTNPQTEAQQAWRQVFADGIAAWHALSEAEKDEWRKKAKKKRMVGQHLFQSHYLNSHKLE